MNVSGISTAGAATSFGVSPAKAAGQSAEQAFLNYMKETPAQRMEDAWLQQQGLTRADLDKMNPTERQKVLDKMKQAIEAQMKDKIRQNAKKDGVDITV